MGETRSTQRIKTILKEGIFSDVTFNVGAEKNQEKIKAHKYVLSTASPVFYSMFNHAQHPEEIRIEGADPTTFKTFLRYIYLNKNDDKIVDSKSWAPLLYLSNRFEFPSLKEKCQHYVMDNCDLGNSCSFFVQAQVHPDVLDLIPFIKTKISSLVSKSLFRIQSNEMLKRLLSVDELNIDEINLFAMALSWASAQIKDGDHGNGNKLRKILGPALYAIRFPRMRSDEFINEVLPMKVLSDQEVSCVIKREEKCPFPSHPRIRSCTRIQLGTRQTLRTHDHSIRFKADKPVKIHGYTNFGSTNGTTRFEGKIYLKTAKRKVLGEASFSDLKHSTTYFDEPISIEANTWYFASMKLGPDSSMDTTIGVSTQPSATNDGVEWTFQNDPKSKETNIDGGLLPIIIFSRVD